MQVNLQALERSLAKIEEVGKDELPFEANGVALVLRSLLPSEEEIIDAYARVAYTADLSEFEIDLPEVPVDKDDDDDDDGDPLAIIRHRIWLDRLRQATLGCAIVEIDGQDLRGVDYLETGEVDDNGNSVSVLKRDWVRGLITRWTRPVLTQMFATYSELMDKINLKASKLVQFDTADIEEELRRLRVRLADLELHKAKAAEPALRTKVDPPTAQKNAERANQGTAGQMDRLADHTVQKQEEARHEEEEEAYLPGPSPQPAPEQSQSPTQPPVRRSSIPTPQQHAPQQRASEQDPDRIPDPYDGNSIYDPADGDDAIAAENARQEAMYRRKLQRDAAMKAEREASQAKAAEQGKTLISGQARRPSAAPPGGAVSVGQPAQRAPLNQEPAVVATPNQQIQRGAPTPTTPKPSGKMGNVDVYRQPTTTLERRGPPTELDKIQIDTGSTSRNPRFKPANED